LIVFALMRLATEQMPFYNLFVHMPAAHEDEAQLLETVEEAGIDMMVAISEAIADPTFEAMVFGTTVLNPLQARLTVQISRPLEVAVFAATAEPFIGLAARLLVGEVGTSSKGMPLHDGGAEAIEIPL
jgi:hypothetical protein